MMTDGGLQRAQIQGRCGLNEAFRREQRKLQEEAERWGIEPLWEKKGWRLSAFHLARNRFAHVRRSDHFPAFPQPACLRDFASRRKRPSFAHLRLVGPFVPREWCVKTRSMPSSKAPALHLPPTDREELRPGAKPVLRDKSARNQRSAQSFRGFNPTAGGSGSEREVGILIL